MPGNQKSIVVAVLFMLPALWLRTMAEDVPAVSATGGDLVYDISVDDLPYRVHVFTNVGTASFMILVGGPVELLVVAGGGGGGVDRDSGGGGGAGGFLVTNLSVSTGVHDVSVGSGGAGYIGSGSMIGTGVNGNGSSVFGVVAAGGGGGGTRSGALEGGSGGGGGAGGRSLLAITGAEGLPGQGHRGGAAFDAAAGFGQSGGGGGAGAVGGDYDSGDGAGGAGGTGVVSSIAGAYAAYGGGGGGGAAFNAGAPGPGGLGGGGSGGKATGNENGSGAGQDGLDGTGGGGGGAGTRGTGTRGGNGGSGIVVIRYALDSVSFLTAQPFTLANIETGSTRFTNTNEVDVIGLTVPPGCTHFQITESGDPSAVDDGGWIPTNQPPTIESFALPAADTNVTLYAWFTNTAEAVWLHRAQGSIVYTTVLPEPVAPAELTRGIIPGESVAVLSILDIDTGSTGGRHDETELNIIGRSLFCAADSTPNEPYVTLEAIGQYVVTLTVTNEAGNQSTASTTVNVVPAGTYTYYVDINNFGGDAPPYSSWATAATNIQHAVDQAEAGLDIAGGVYSEVIVADGVYPLTATLVISEAITVRSVNGRAATVIDGQYPAYANRCVLITGAATLDGFAISNGYALATGGDLSEPDPLAHRRGGGIYVYGAAAKILNCDIVFNRSAAVTAQLGQGAGIALVGANDALVFNSLIANNDTMREGRGTGLYMDNSAALVTQCVISDNLQIGNSGDGGGFWMNSGILSNSLVVANYASRYDANRITGGLVTHSVITNNHGRSAGGGVGIYGGRLEFSTIVDNRTGTEGGGGLHIRGGTVANCLIVGNTTTAFGGGVHQNRGTLVNSVIIGNHANSRGGGINTAEHAIRNCLIAGNNTDGAGGGIWRGANSTGHTMQNCTLVRNRAGTEGGGVYTSGSYANVFRNLIVYDNQAAGVSNDAAGNHASWHGNFQHSRAAELTAGVNGNITADPRFRRNGSGYGVDAVMGDYTLRSSSPAIDAGLYQAWMLTALDLQGNPRIIPEGGTVDMGAYETVPLPVGTMLLMR